MKDTDYGLYEGDRGQIICNPTKFILAYLNSDGKNFAVDCTTKLHYEYCEKLGIFVQVDMDEIKRDLMDYFNYLSPNGWTVGFEKQYIPAFTNLVPWVNDFDSRKNILVFSNCCFHIKNKKRLKHNSKWHRTVLIPYNYDRTTECPIFNQYLRDITCQNEILEQTLEEVLGYMLYPSSKAHKLVIFLGEGANSKSTFMTLMKKLAGKDNTSAVPLKDFEKAFTRHSLKGKMLNIVPEGEFLKVDTLISGIVKQFITGDEVSGYYSRLI